MQKIQDNVTVNIDIFKYGLTKITNYLKLYFKKLLESKQKQNSEDLKYDQSLQLNNYIQKLLVKVQQSQGDQKSVKLQLNTLSNLLHIKINKNESIELKHNPKILQFFQKLIIKIECKKCLVNSTSIQQIIAQLLYFISRDQQYTKQNMSLLQKLKCFKINNSNILLIFKVLQFVLFLKNCPTRIQLVNKNREMWQFLTSDGIKISGLIIDLMIEQIRLRFFCFALMDERFLSINCLENKEEINKSNKANKQNPLEVKKTIQYLNHCYKINHSVFKFYIELVKEFLDHDFISESFYEFIMMFLIEKWDKNLEKQFLSDFLESFNGLQSKTKLNQAKCMVLSILIGKIQYLHEYYFQILPNLQYFGEQIKSQFFLKQLSIYIKNNDKKDINIQFFNHMVQWRILTTSIKNKQLQKEFNSIFKKNIKLLKQQSIVLMYKCNNQISKYLLNIIINILKQQPNIKEESFQKYLFPKKLFNEAFTQSQLQICMKIFIIFFLKFQKDDQILHFFEIYEKDLFLSYVIQFSLIKIRFILISIYENSILPYYFKLRNTKNILTLNSLGYIVKVQSLLYLQITQRAKMIQQDIFKIYISQEQKSIIKTFSKIFIQFTYKTSALMFLSSIFYSSLYPQRFQAEKELLRNCLQKFLKKMEQSKYMSMNSYSSEAFMQLIYIYYLKEIQKYPEILNLVIKLILNWISFIQQKQVFQIFQSCKYDYLSICLKQKKLKIMNLLGIQNPNSFKIFLVVNQRFQSFMYLYQMILKKYIHNENHALKNIIKSQLGTKINFNYDLLENQDFKLIIKLHIDKSSLSFGHNIKLGILKHQFYRIHISNQIAIYSKDINNKQDLKNRFSHQKAAMDNILSIQINFKITEKQVNIKINEIKTNIHMNNESMSQCFIQLQTSFSYIEIIQVNRQALNQNFRFSFNEQIQYKNNFYLKIEQLKTVQTGVIRKYLNLKYLFTLFHQMIKNDLINLLMNINKLYECLLRIIFLKIQSMHLKNSEQIIYFLEKIIKISSEYQNKFPFSIIQQHLFKFAEKYENHTQVLYTFVTHIILNFDIWKDCLFEVQLNAIQLFKKLLNLKQFKIKCMSQKLPYQKLIFARQNYYSLNKSASYKGINLLQRQKIRQLIESIATDLVSYSDFNIFREKLCINLQYIVRRCAKNIEKKAQNSKSIQLERMIQEFLNKNSIQNYKKHHSNSKDNNIKQKFQNLIKFFRCKQIIIIFKYIHTPKLQQKILLILLSLSQFVEDKIYSSILQNLLPNLSFQQFGFMYEKIQSILSSHKHKQQTFGQSIIEFLILIINNYSWCQKNIKSNIIRLILIYIQQQKTGPLENNQKNKFRASIVNFLLKQNTIKFLITIQKNYQQEIIKKLVDNYFMFILQLQKKLLFKFNQEYVKHNNLISFKIYLNYIKNIDKSNSLYIISLGLQYCYQFLQSVKQNKEHHDFIYEIAEDFLFHILQKYKNQIYYAFPVIGYPNFTKIIEQSSFKYVKQFEIKGGVLFKLLINFFTLWQMCPNQKLLDVIEIIFIKNIQQYQNDKKLLKKNKSNFQKQSKYQTKDFSIFAQVKNSNGITEMIQKINKQQLDYSMKYDRDIGQSLYQKNQQNIPLDLFFLQYVILKFQSLLEDSKSSQDLKQSCMLIEGLIEKLKDKYPNLKHWNEIRQQNNSNLKYNEFKNKYFLVSTKSNSENILNCNSPVYVNQASKNSFSIASLFSVNGSEIGSPKYENPTIRMFSPRSRFYQRKNTYNDMKVQDLKSYGEEIIKLEFLYLYLLQQHNKNEVVPIYELQNVDDCEEEFLKNMEKQNEEFKQRILKEVNKYNHSYQKQIKSVSSQDQVLFQVFHKKEPILKLRKIELPNYNRPITRLTSNYDYVIQRQWMIDQNIRKSIMYRYSIIKRQSFIRDPQDYAQSVKQFTENEQNKNIMTFQIQYVTRIGVYFGTLEIDINTKFFYIQTSKDGRPDKQSLKLGSSKQFIIKNKVKRKKIYFQDISEIQTRKFCQISRNSIQIFTKQAKSYFIMLYQNKNVKKLLQFVKPYFRENVLVYDCEETFKKRKYTQKWQNNQISNFDYLMLINKYSGRTYNDTNQAYIFPWILTDYTSKTINLKNQQIYRDLKLPIGALNPNKFKLFKQKYQSNLEYFYGTLYSTPMYLYYYLIRLQPYTSLARELQGGSFDAPDRLFFSVCNIWESILSESTGDIKELIPQFYYFPTFLQNINKVKFGTTQKGVLVNDVELPPWANNDTNRFITIMRNALESDYVSKNLHLWIDLIFGAYQNSLQRKNIYQSRYYQQNINYKKFQDYQIEPLIDQVCGWGQFPVKLFKIAHPQKKSKVWFFGDLYQTSPGMQVKSQYFNKKIVQEINLYDKVVVFKILENKLEKYYLLEHPILKNYENKKQIAKQKIPIQPYLTIKSKKNQTLYLINKEQQIYLKQLKLKRNYRKIVVGDRFIGLCGRQLVVLDFSEKQYFKWDIEQVLNAVFIRQNIIFITKSGKLNKYNFEKNLLTELYRQTEPIKYDAKLLGYEENHQENYVICIDKRKIIYIKNSLF